VSNDFSRSYTLPILKDNKKCLSNSLSMNDFHGITSSPVMSKVFESCFPDHYKQYFVTSDNQSGLKKDSVVRMPTSIMLLFTCNLQQQSPTVY